METKTKSKRPDRVQVTVYLTPKEHARLTALAEGAAWSLSETIRYMLRASEGRDFGPGQQGVK